MATNETNQSEPLSPIDMVHRQGKAKFTMKGSPSAAGSLDYQEENDQRAFEENHALLKDLLQNCFGESKDSKHAMRQL